MSDLSGQQDFGQQDATPSSSSAPPTAGRAAKACRRCHRKKLRCHGGCPCFHCKKAHQSCDLGDAKPSATDTGVSTEADERVVRLEKLVHRLLEQVGTRNEAPIKPSVDPFSIQPTPEFTLPTSSARQPELFDPSLERHVRDTPESRLALSRAADHHRGPLRPLAFHPAHWENSDMTRPPSPFGNGSISQLFDDFWAPVEVSPRLDSDPLSVGIVDETTAKSLLEFFLNRCHPFLPVLEFARPPQERLAELREMGPYLFTVTLAVASRFQTTSHSFSPLVDSETSHRIRRLAYAHFASSQFRRHQNLRDLQATIFLAGWGLHPTPEGPDPWMTTQYGGRLAYRIGLNKLGPRLLDRDMTQLSHDDRVKLVGRYKTWLCWWCFDTAIELGFGRPSMSKHEPDETTLLRLIEGHPKAEYQDSVLYLVGLTRLNKIAREFSSWLQQHELEASQSHGPILEHCNQQLDQWCQTWLWKGSAYFLQLGRFSRLLKLRSEHVRLTVNALALNSATGPSDSHVNSAAMSALEVVQAYIDSAESDQMLTFCLDNISLIVGHALVFLIHLYLSTTQTSVEKPVILHYLQTGSNTMVTVDISVNGQTAHIGRTCRDLCRAANIPLDGSAPAEQNVTDFSSFTPGYPLWSSEFFDDANFLSELGVTDKDTGWMFGLNDDANE